MRIRSIYASFVLFLALTFVTTQVPGQKVEKLPPIPVKEYKLKNGLRVIIAEDHFAPVFSIAVTYNVGSRNERAGRTGFAHLFEHMMFKGSPNVGSGEHFLLVFSNGGDMNGSTNKERTNYYERLPTNQLDLALFLESDRMRALDINKANLDNQIGTVSEERRQGVDNQPYGKTSEVLEDLATAADIDHKASAMDDIRRRLKARDVPKKGFCWNCRKPLHARANACAFCGEVQ